MGVTIKDIAKAAGVSHMTVSRALNNHSSVKPETKEKIQTLAKEMGYSPNIGAKGLVLKRSFNIGLFFSSINKGTSPDFFHKISSEINNVVRDKYNLVIRGVDDCKYFNNVSQTNFDGVILVSQSDDDRHFIQEVRDKQIPLVVINRRVENITSILINDEQGIKEACSYLIRKGHKDIGFIEGTTSFASCMRRSRGAKAAMDAHNLTINPNWVKCGEYDIDEGYAAMRSLMSGTELPTAVLCYNDDMAIGAIKAANDLGYKVPEDVSIVGFDNSTSAQYVTPTLTTVSRKVEEMARLGIEKLLEEIDGKEKLEAKEYVLDTELVIRASVKEI